MADRDDFVLDPKYADWVWNHIEASPHIYWPDDEQLTYQVETGSETATFYRDGTWGNHSWQDWNRKRGRGSPAFVETPLLEFRQGKVESVYLAGVSYTSVGSWYTFEVQEDAGGPAVFDPIRLPVTDGMIEEAKEWAADYGGEHIRTKGVEFQERFATALGGDEAEAASAQLNDVHIRIGGVTSDREAKRIFEEATDMAERAVVEVL